MSTGPTSKNSYSLKSKSLKSKKLNFNALSMAFRQSKMVMLYSAHP